MNGRRFLARIIALVLCCGLVMAGLSFGSGEYHAKAAAMGSIPTVESSIALEGSLLDHNADGSDTWGQPNMGFSEETLSSTEDDTEQSEAKEVISSVPMNASVVQSGDLAAKLTWKAESKDALYKICRSESKNGSYSQIAVVENVSGSYSYEDKNKTLGKTYFYRVLEYINGKLVEQSDVVYCTLILQAPKSVTVTLTGTTSVKVAWSKVDLASGYYVYRSNSKDTGYYKIATVKAGTLEYTDASVVNGKPYYYKVKAYASGKEIATSRDSDVGAYYMKPVAPVITGEFQKDQIRLSWARPTGGETFTIYRANEKGAYEKIGTTTGLSYYDPDVTVGKYYKYKVQASYKKDGKTIAGDYSASCQVYASGIDPNKPMIALTFDDGPSSYTQTIVDCLEKNNARATFFVVGNRVNSYKSQLKAAFDAGCEIGNHTWSHPTLTRLSTADVKSQISRTDNVVKSITGTAPTIYRAPGGATNSRVRSNIAKPHIFWSIDTLDWKHRNSQKTINSVLNNVRDGDIILMHDIHKPTMQAALYLIPELKKRGYQMVTVSELAKYKGVNMKNGITYYSFR